MENYLKVPVAISGNTALNLGAKMLYGAVAALCNNKGFCWANNSYLAKILGVTTRSITRYLAQLRDAGLVCWTGADQENYWARRQIRVIEPQIDPTQEDAPVMESDAEQVRSEGGQEYAVDEQVSSGDVDERSYAMAESDHGVAKSSQSVADSDQDSPKSETGIRRNDHGIPESGEGIRKSDQDSPKSGQDVVKSVHTSGKPAAGWGTGRKPKSAMEQVELWLKDAYSHWSPQERKLVAQTMEEFLAHRKMKGCPIGRGRTLATLCDRVADLGEDNPRSMADVLVWTMLNGWKNLFSIRNRDEMDRR